MAKKRIYYTEFRRHLDSEELKTFYLFTGAEVFLKEEGVRAIVDKALPAPERSMNLETLYADTDVSGREASDRALTLPFCAARRVILVRQADKWRQADVNALLAYARNPSLSTVVILVSQEERLKQSHWKALAESAYHVECYPLFDNQIPGWIERRVGDHGKRITREAMHMLMERVGHSLSDLDNEVNKLVNYTGAKPVLEAGDILAAAGHIRQNSIHDLNLALGRADLTAAMGLVDQVITEGMRPIQILGAVAWHFRNLYALRSRLDAGEKLEEILGNMKNPQARRETQSQANTYSRPAFSKIFEELLKLDERLKTGKGHWQLYMQLAVLKICRQYAAPRAEFV
ncbi:DNA polymerase III subunit delta [candidate division FCPU426 bacterium]|nr:DNA polymerase III subunit delta [candidate division FCPU426 bacterium]